MPLRGPWGWALLAGVWSLAAAGIWSVWALRNRKTWARTLIYICMGWIGIFAVGEILRVFPASALAWLLAGGAAYSIGAVIFITDRPHLWPGRFAAHDLWHVLVLTGSACHFMLMLEVVVPHA